MDSKDLDRVLRALEAQVSPAVFRSACKALGIRVKRKAKLPEINRRDLRRLRLYARVTGFLGLSRRWRDSPPASIAIAKSELIALLEAKRDYLLLIDDDGDSHPDREIATVLRTLEILTLKLS